MPGRIAAALTAPRHRPTRLSDYDLLMTAIHRFGTNVEVAKRLGVTKSLISQMKRSRRCSPEMRTRLSLLLDETFGPLVTGMKAIEFLLTHIIRVLDVAPERQRQRLIWIMQTLDAIEQSPED